MSGRKKNNTIKHLAEELIKNPKLLFTDRFVRLSRTHSMVNWSRLVVEYIASNNLMTSAIVKEMIKSNLIYGIDTRLVCKILNGFNKEDFDFFIQNTYFNDLTKLLSIDFMFIDFFNIKDELVFWFFEMFPELMLQVNEEEMYYLNPPKGFLKDDMLEKLAMHDDHKVRLAARSYLNKCLD